ncbi:nucleotide pyrophosphatase [Bacillaceae bacterium SAS-127]|nr:nucleotide pyrophosphatase [Bacillaceae bacterium SAS-127]
MQNKLIFITIDGLRFDTAVSQMGYINHLVEKGTAARYKVQSELPSMSRPLYEVLLTGTPAYQNGITHNGVVRLSHEKSLFHLTKEQGRTNATASYYWVSELYSRAPFLPERDRFQFEGTDAIEKGIFYWEDHYPDSHLFADANYLLHTYKPDFLYIHSMNVDDDGHKFTSDSKQYRGRAIGTDIILAHALPQWLKEGYQVIVTADHGMNTDGLHGGTTFEERSVPLYIISEKVKPQIVEEEIPQLQLAPLACHLLNIQPSSAMQPLTIPGVVGASE